jgi:fluoroacetyl-CoA thioesterase
MLSSSEPATVLRHARDLSYICRMNNEVAPGITRTRTYQTTMDMRARQLQADVFSTPAMIGLMERTCVELTEPYLDENEQTVGIHVDVRHMAPTKIGQKITVTAELLEVKEKKLRYSVCASNDQGVKIGEGMHRRAVINIKTFNSGA